MGGWRYEGWEWNFSIRRDTIGSSRRSPPTTAVLFISPSPCPAHGYPFPHPPVLPTVPPIEGSWPPSAHRRAAPRGAWLQHGCRVDPGHGVAVGEHCGGGGADWEGSGGGILGAAVLIPGAITPLPPPRHNRHETHFMRKRHHKATRRAFWTCHPPVSNLQPLSVTTGMNSLQKGRMKKYKVGFPTSRCRQPLPKSSPRKKNQLLCPIHLYLSTFKKSAANRWRIAQKRATE